MRLAASSISEPTSARPRRMLTRMATKSASDEEDGGGVADRLLDVGQDHLVARLQHQCPPPTQCGPSASWPVVLVPIGGPWMTRPVFTVEHPARDLHGEAVHAPRSRTTLLLTRLVVLRAVARALEPLRGLHTTAHGSPGAGTSGTAPPHQPPCRASTGAGYTFSAFSSADAGYSVIHMRPSARYKNPVVGLDRRDHVATRCRPGSSSRTRPSGSATGTRSPPHRSPTSARPITRDDRPVEELTTGDADRLRVRRHVLRQITRRRPSPTPAHDAPTPPPPRPDDPTPAASTSASSTDGLSRLRVSRDNAPVADPTSRRRAAANSTTPANTTTTGMTITRGFMGDSYLCPIRARRTGLGPRERRS